MLAAVILGSAGIWGGQWLEKWSEWKGAQPIPAVVFTLFGWGALLFSLAIGFL